MAASEKTRLPRRFSLGAKLGIALLAVAVAMLAFLLVEFGPAARRGFLERCEVLVARGGRAMREIAREDTDSSRRVLQDLIRHTADARRRVLQDLPLSLYGGDVERIRAAVQRDDVERSRRLEANVDVLAREMAGRSERRIDRHVAQLTAEQNVMAEGFASEAQRSYLVLSGAVFAALILVLGGGLYRAVVYPVRLLRAASRTVAQGDLTVEVGSPSRDEVGELAADFATMVGQLRESRAEIDRNNQELSRWNQRLEEEVAHKTNNLAAALDDLRRTQKQLVHAEKMASVGTLAGGVAHEFNNLIGGIRGCASEALAGEVDADRRETLAVILRAAKRANAITAELLRFARQRVEPTAGVDVAAVIQQALRLCEPDARRAGVAVEVALATDLRAFADAGALQQVFLNLFRNAVQAMPDGGVLRVEGARAGGELWLRVADTGVGIPQDALGHVFEPFFTSKDREVDPARRGTGLGLAVSYGIVEAHGGTIEVMSEPGEGSVFTIRIPAGAGSGAERGDR